MGGFTRKRLEGDGPKNETLGRSAGDKLVPRLIRRKKTTVPKQLVGTLEGIWEVIVG